MATPAPAPKSGAGSSGASLTTRLTTRLTPASSSASASPVFTPSFIRPPSLLSSLSSARAAPALVSDVRAVSVAATGSSTGASASAFTSSIDVSRQIVSRPNAGDTASTPRRRGPGSVVSTVRSSTSVSTATATVASASVVASAASTRAAPPSSVSSVSGPVPPQNAPAPEAAAPEAAPGDDSVAESVADSASSAVPDTPSVVSPVASSAAEPSRIQPTLPSANAQTQIAEARRALDASIANLLDTQLQDRAVLMHGNMRAISEQQRDLGKAVTGLRKANDGLSQLVDDVTMPLKEMGNMQNWAEMQYRGMLTLGETLRLVREKRPREEEVGEAESTKAEAKTTTAAEAAFIDSSGAASAETAGNDADNADVASLKEGPASADLLAVEVTVDANNEAHELDAAPETAPETAPEEKETPAKETIAELQPLQQPLESDDTAKLNDVSQSEVDAKGTHEHVAGEEASRQVEPAVEESASREREEEPDDANAIDGLNFGRLNIGPPLGCMMPALPASFTAYSSDAIPTPHEETTEQPGHDTVGTSEHHATGDEQLYGSAAGAAAEDEKLASVEEQIDQFIKELDAERLECSPPPLPAPGTQVETAVEDITSSAAYAEALPIDEPDEADVVNVLGVPEPLVSANAAAAGQTRVEQSPSRD
ncbi:hypothetical protein F503_00436 [Ophiostoma piceae UAMH 11346]|uniref:Biogenesis of lysosome-related organelles complex 1 subunit 1 n=1 Tax=Ophiostoma piceae (strain UAMH 11346) TaxID=1262450 RepID=S3C2J5_OPHP1|nr:hypothetical protein F503_00436 [Ophiostoma piceae UAMH 11346]